MRASLSPGRESGWDRHGNPTLGLCVPAPPRAGAADSLSGGASRSVEATAAQCVVTVRDLSDRYWKGVGFLPWAILCPRFCGQSPLCLQRSQNIEERRPRWHLYKIDPFTVCRLCEFPEQRLGQAWRVIPVRRGSHTGRDETPAAKPNGHRQRPLRAVRNRGAPATSGPAEKPKRLRNGASLTPPQIIAFLYVWPCEFPEQRLGQARRVIPVRQGSQTGRDETPAAKPNTHPRRPARAVRNRGARPRDEKNPHTLHRRSSFVLPALA